MSTTLELDDWGRATPGGPEETASALAGAMALAWHRGERPTTEELLAAHPEVAECPEAVIRIIYEEVILRREAGDPLDERALAARFPRWQAELAMLLACDRMIQPVDVATPTWPVSTDPAWPEVGSRLGGFRLIEALGSGGMGRTFLALDPDLADRPVVLKVTPRGLAEHLSLARLQHTHVVPLYASPEFPEQNLRALCMPYLGGASLDRVCAEIQSKGEGRPTGRSIVDAIDRLQSTAMPQVRTEGPARRLLCQMPYPEAIAWIAACLADALQDAHDRGLVHMDVKPANVLIAGDGTPMLLDFHLAREPVHPDSPPPPWIGGTPRSMAPEQRAAMEAVRAGVPVETAVDGRADIFGLGRLMEEALEVPRGREGVTPGLRAIVGHCVEPDPRDRYEDAARLADDLRRHLDDRPLVGVGEPSLLERWAKWRRRSPHSLSRSTMLALAAIGLLALVLQGRSRLVEAESMLHTARRQFEHGRYEAARTAAEGALALARPWPGGRQLRLALGEIRDQARRALAAEELHAMVESLRFLCGTNAPASRLGPLRAGLTALLAAWETGRSLANRPEFPLAPGLSRRVGDDLRDLALLVPELELKLESSSPARLRAVHERALTLLDDAEAILGPSRALADARRTHATALGMTELAKSAAVAAESCPPTTASEYHSLGLARLQDGDDRGALAAFNSAVDLDPADFWPTFHRGMTAYRLGHHADALADFHACVALSPRSADCYYNRALAHASLGQIDRALRDDERALELDPTLAEAALNAGLHHYRLGQFAPAAASLRRALELKADPAVVHYNLALVSLAQGERAGALAHLDRAGALQQAQALRDRLLKEP